MIKRTIPLLFAVAVMIVTAVPARANHCVRCQFFVDYSVCKWGTSFGSTDCDDSTGVCELIGESCRDFTASAGSPGPGEIRNPRTSLATASATSKSSGRRTTTFAPSSRQ